MTQEKTRGVGACTGRLKEDVGVGRLPTFHGTPLAVPSPTLSANNASTWHPRLLQPAETDRITKRMHHRQIKPSTVSHFSNLMAFLLETSNLR